MSEANQGFRLLLDGLFLVISSAMHLISLSYLFSSRMVYVLVGLSKFFVISILVCSFCQLHCYNVCLLSIIKIYPRCPLLRHAKMTPNSAKHIFLNQRGRKREEKKNIFKALSVTTCRWTTTPPTSQPNCQEAIIKNIKAHSSKPASLNLLKSTPPQLIQMD